MLEVGGNRDLTEEPLGTDRPREFRSQNLDGDVALVSEILSEVYERHAAATDFAVDGVAALEGLTEATEYVVQCAFREKVGGIMCSEGT